jgi:hypothetical protein
MNVGFEGCLIILCLVYVLSDATDYQIIYTLCGYNPNLNLIGLIYEFHINPYQAIFFLSSSGIFFVKIITKHKTIQMYQN